MKIILKIMLNICLVMPVIVCVFVVASLDCLAENNETLCTKLTKAIQNSDQSIVREVIESGFAVDTECLMRSRSLETEHPVSLTPLIASVESGNTLMVELLLKLGADINKALK
ncbi:MAG: ankyrin repeat domain-containing protein, partial [Candidatus Adiutrix sp.]|nr:ankyrin repeat domain-containing protein [Candidatus Adiutrix sp.]